MATSSVLYLEACGFESSWQEPSSHWHLLFGTDGVACRLSHQENWLFFRGGPPKAIRFPPSPCCLSTSLASSVCAISPQECELLCDLCHSFVRLLHGQHLPAASKRDDSRLTSKLFMVACHSCAAMIKTMLLFDSIWSHPGTYGVS